MAAVLQQVLERAELTKLPKAVQGKLERFLADQQSEIDGLRTRHERYKVDSGELLGPAVPSFSCVSVWKKRAEEGKLGGIPLLQCAGCFTQRDEAKRTNTNLLFSVALNFPSSWAVLAAVMDIIVRYIYI